MTESPEGIGSIDGPGGSRILCNARVTGAPVTGVQRYANEIMARVPGLSPILPPAYLRRPFNLAWEQFVLPSLASGSVLWSPANVGPLAVERHVVTVHDLATRHFPDDYSAVYRRFFEWLSPRLLPRAEAIITVSDYTRRQLVHEFSLDADRVHVIPNGVDHGHFRPRPRPEVEAVRAKHRLPRRFVLFLGTLSPRKNLAGLLAAWRSIESERARGVELVVAGSAGDRGVFAAGPDLADLPRDVRLIGRVSDADLPSLLTAAEIFVFPSFFEGFGLPPLEAMACGTPCIVTNATAVPEVVGDAAITVDPWDPEALGAEMLRLLEAPDLRSALSQASRARAAAFSWDVSAARHAEVFQEVAARNRPAQVLAA